MIKRLTRQRRAILEVVRSSSNHPDAAWIYEQVRKKLPSISLGTVYRTLDALVAEGLLQPLARPGQPLRYEAHLDGHLHMVCSRCGNYYDLSSNLPDLLSLARSQHPELELQGVTVEFSGICPRCKEAEALAAHPLGQLSDPLAAGEPKLRG